MNERQRAWAAFIILATAYAVLRDVARFYSWRAEFIRNVRFMPSKKQLEYEEFNVPETVKHAGN